MAQPVWITPPGSLGTIPENIFYQVPIEAYEPDLAETVYYRVIAGALPQGVQLSEAGILAGVPKATGKVQGVPTEISRDVTSKFAVRAYTVVPGTGVINRLSDRTFTLTIAGQDFPEFVTPPGKIAEFYDGVQITSVQNGETVFYLPIEYTDTDPDDIVIVRLISGSLPPGATLLPNGHIVGYIDLVEVDTSYEFTIEINDGKNSDLRTFSILVYARSSMTADNTVITADNTFITADVSPNIIPFIITPQGTIGTTRGDNFFAFQFTAISLDEDDYEFVATTALPPGLILDSVTGWLYGYIPNIGVTESVYDFTLKVFKTLHPSDISAPYNYSLTITGPVSSEITWLTDSNLGTIDNGATSTFYVQAISQSGLELQYQLKSGSNSLLPQGLQLLPSGHIAGRVSFNTFALDGGTTIFDAAPVQGIVKETTFDLKFTFTVNVFSINGVVNTNKEFSITVNRAYNVPYENLYIKAMPPFDDRNLIDSLLQNTDIFPNNLIYRSDDPNFGIATNVVYMHAFGLTASTYEEYVSSLYENHYWKDLVLGNIEVAQATDGLGNVIYEVVYSPVIDNLLNTQGESVSKAVTLPFPINENDSTEIDTVYPNSLINMRDQVIDTVGEVGEVLPTWMISKQANGSVLGFVPAWVIAYAKPGKGNQLAYNIRTQFGNQLNLIDFEVDRYELDRLLTKNWDPIYDSTGGSWIPHPPTLTTFDYGSTNNVDLWLNDDGDAVAWINDDSELINWTSNYDGEPTVFDGNSLQFIDPVDMYSDTDEYDKYLVFPKRTILG